MVDIFNNKESFRMKNPKKLWLVLIISIAVFIILIILIYKLQIYDNYQTKGYVICEDTCRVETYIPTNIKVDKISLNNKNLKYKVLSQKLQVDEKSLTSYYELTLKVNKTLSNNEILELNFYYNKQRIIKKIINKVF